MRRPGGTESRTEGFLTFQMVRTCPYSCVKWTSESQGERTSPAGIPVTRAGVATVIRAKGIAR